MNTIIGLKEFRVNLPKYEAEIKKGRSFTVVKRSRPAFRVLPPDPWEGLPEVDPNEDSKGWETLVDFRKLTKDGNGIEAGELLRRIQRVNAEEDKKRSKAKRKLNGQNRQVSRKS
ncbi:MAG: hypothetical protein COV07_03925 [Candidatus Vogelbacteria bacterium CG10_big_fil_rev_8_21_14_0_10_45_14]|uniref:Antitoxin n=1 Tax=Candidatus Vogelbacteria bacterium CG10_big_fil_rev_8_21_14_0_10_45_14 TaxID=1975042 RepID=A0A2H0RKK6_9BACT|nr:MAG: hypothetical protein COV07_03925 [Candidatus Vogelbacteria bacterium CG10_big_fil_rev_8_21_14_0_10_45_14]